MPFVPGAVSPSDAGLDLLKWPEHKVQIGRLTLAQKQSWYAAQDPHDLIELNADFQQWWKWHYLVPLRCKRLVYTLKFW